MVKEIIHKLTGNSPNFRMHRYPKEQGYVYSCDAFRDILHRECARSDRNGHAFSLAVLHLPASDNKEGAEIAEKIVDHVGDRLRVTDQAGWLDGGNRQLAVLLYACSDTDARNFVERVRKGSGVYDIEYDVYVYPEQFPPEMTESKDPDV